MNIENHEKFLLNDEKEKRLWKESIFVFDTSALIDFYYYPKETRSEIYEKVFKTLKGRLWIPHHVQFEYLNNRENIIEKPIREKYDPLKNDKISKLKSAGKRIKVIAEAIKNDTKKPEKHPFLPQGRIDQFLEFANVINTTINEFETALNAEILNQENEIKSLNENDSILEVFMEYFEVGEESSFEEIMEIVEEGKLRYKFQIPPGYMDLEDKKGTQIFGDLIIWKQLLEHAEEKETSVIFICNDLKIDWCYKDSNNRIESPRQELIKEFFDNNEKEFWMYDQSQFLYKAKEILEVEFEDTKIEEVSKIIDEKNRDELIFKCGYCNEKNLIQVGDFTYDFEFVGSSERNMGREKHYRVVKPAKCNICKNISYITYEIWEYPIGIHNYDEVKIDVGEIIQAPDFVNKFWEKVYADELYRSDIEQDLY